jgi:hypothetical protein
MRLNSSTNQSLMIIENIIEPNIYEYYLRLNSNDTQGVAQLFSEDGLLQPPFEKVICGREAIAQYLESEARAIEAWPKLGTGETLDDGSSRYQVRGHVKTSCFTVNVCWKIQLNVNREIKSVEVKLLADLQDLLTLKQV